MSRCFPYPPPGYETPPLTLGVALSESIKREEGKKAKKERRKDKKHEKKEKEKIGVNGQVEDKKHSHKRWHKDQRSQVDEKGVDHHKRSEYETEQIEKSNLTHENGHPVAPRQNLSNSTDSTSNSNKRQKHNSGNLIRIRLPPQGHNDPEVVISSLEQPCSSRKIDGYVQETATLHGSTSVTCKDSLIEKPCFMPLVSKTNAYVQEKCSTSKTHKESVIEQPAREVPCSTCRASKIVGEKRKTAHVPRLHPLELQFRNLFDDWAPLSLQMLHTSTDLDDQNWLFRTKQNRKCGAERSFASSIGLSGSNSSPWPRSYYLPEADIYALPYTIPF